MPGHIFRLGDTEVDLDRYELRREGQVVKLEKIPMELLLLLIKKQGELVTREEIIARLWGREVFVDTQQGINTAVRKIRLALRDNPEQPRFVQTVVGKGYRIVAPEAVTAAVPPASVVAQTVSRTHQRRWMMGAAAFLLIGLLVAISPAERGRGLSQLAEQPIRSIAVLPLENLSGNPAEEYFADGMTEALITDLAKIRSIRVISRTSVMPFKGSRKSLPEIAQVLKVDAVVEGAVARSGDHVRVTAQLIYASTDHHLWAEQYDRDLHDILSLQSEVAAAIAREVRVSLTPEEHLGLVSRATVDPAAYEAYLRGRYYWNQRTKDGMQKGIEFFGQAIELDPTGAPAYAGLADCYIGLGSLSYLAPKDAFPQAKAAAARAIELDPALADPHASLAYAKLYYDWDWAGAESEFQRALALNPAYAIGHDWYSVYLTAMGRHKEALAEIQRAQTLDPLSLAINTDAGFEAYYSGRYEDAVQQLRAVLTVNPNFPLAHFWLGRTYQQMHSYDQAIAEYDSAEHALGDWPVTIAALGNIYGLASRREDALRVLDHLQKLSAQEYVTSYGVGLVYAGLGENDGAITLLRKGAEERTNWMVWLKLDPRWEKLRGDSRFSELLRRVGFAS